MSRAISITVNGTKHSQEVEPSRLLVEFLREELRLTGTHVGCDTPAIAAAAAKAGDGVKLSSDLAASTEFRNQLLTVHARRALPRAVEAAKG